MAQRPHLRGRTNKRSPALAKSRCDSSIADSSESKTEDDGGSDSDEDDPDSSIQSVTCTPGHDWFSLKRGWVDAEQLKGGERLVGSDGSSLEVVDVETWTDAATVYNFEVEVFHTYFVSETVDGLGVNVHNDGCDIDEIEAGRLALAEAQRISRSKFSDFVSIWQPRITNLVGPDGRKLGHPRWPMQISKKDFQSRLVRSQVGGCEAVALDKRFLSNPKFTTARSSVY